MKRIAASILLLIYFAVSTGFIISMHYCMGKMDSAEIGFTANETCGKCGMETTDSNGCCRDEFKIVKLEMDQLAVKALAVDFSFTALLHSTTEYLLLPFRNFRDDENFIAHSPPLISKQDTYLQNCVFRI